MKYKSRLYLIIILLVLVFSGSWSYKNFNFNRAHQIGEPIDSLNNVYVYYNGGISNVQERNLTVEGYNLGLKYQCVEFVKRYYYEYLNHKMYDTFGNAKDFYDKNLRDNQLNKRRGLTQYSNPSLTKPRINDLLVFNGSLFNKYGHVAIISNLMGSEIEIIQQNPGPFTKSRKTYDLILVNGKWQINSKRILGWLRKE